MRQTNERTSMAAVAKDVAAAESGRKLGEVLPTTWLSAEMGSITRPCRQRGG
jgi:hypothetical protein